MIITPPGSPFLASEAGDEAGDEAGNEVDDVAPVGAKEGPPPAYKTHPTRPMKVNGGRRNYAPLEPVLTHPVSKYQTKSKQYNGFILSAEAIYSFKQLDISASQTLAQLNYQITGERLLHAGVLAVYLLRHRVMIVPASKSAQCKRNAYMSFGMFTAGKLCYPKGDLLMLPGLHNDTINSRTVLAELQLAMTIINKLPVTYTPRCVRVDNPALIPPSFRKKHLVLKELEVIGADPIDFFFKPVFTDLTYHVGSDKARLTVEILQAALIVFMNLTEEALWQKNFGCALFLAHTTRRCALCLLWILGDPEPQGGYLFTMTHWYWARSCYGIGNNWHRLELTLRSYNKTKNQLAKFTEAFFGGMVSHALSLDKDFKWPSPQLEFQFPEAFMQSVDLCVNAFDKIAIDPSWRRSTFEKVSTQALNMHFRISVWSSCVARNVIVGAFHHGIKEMQDIEEDIDKHLQQDYEQDFPFSRVLMYQISAKCCCILSAGKDGVALRSREDPLCVEEWTVHDESHLEKRSMIQLMGLELITKVYQKRNTKKIRGILLKMARHTFFQEVIYVVQKQITHPLRKGGLSRITRVLPYVLYIWFGTNVPIVPGPLENAVPPHEKHIFDQIIGMLFVGCALVHSLAYRGLVDNLEQSATKKAYLNNATYYHALAWPYLQRESVAPAIIDAFCNTLELAEASNIDYDARTLENGASRCCAVLLGHVVTLLPVLWEMCISHKEDYGPNEGERKVMVKRVQYPVEVSCEKLLQIPGQTDLRIVYDSISIYLNYDFGLPKSINGVEVTLRGDVSPEETPDQIICNPTYCDELCSKPFTIVNSKCPVVSRPPLEGICGCSGRYRCCPIENYHSVEEQSFRMEDMYEEQLYDVLFYNFPRPEGIPKRNVTLDEAILKLKRTVGGVLAKTISQFKLLWEEGHKEIKIAAFGNNPAYTYRLDRLLKSLARTEGYLKYPDPPVLVITRVLSSLDEIFHNRQTHAMLRGSFGLQH